MAMRLTRALVAAALAIGVCAGSMATGEPPALEDYAYDGVTTYCYWVAQGLQVDRLSYTYVKAEGKNSECPLTMKLTQLTSGVVKAGGDVEYQIDATLNFNSNKFNMTALQALVYDPAGRQVQIPHANVHACSRATVCDVFRDGNNRRISTQETSNFTTGGVAKFTQKVTFQRAGDYNVFAHIALPPKNPMNESYHFLTFFTTSIADVTATTEATSTGMSTGTTVGIVVGGVIGVILIVVVVIFYRRRPVPMTPGHEHFRHSGGGFAPSHTSKHHTSKLDWNGDPDFQFGHDRYQASSMASEFKQPPGLSATSLMFKDRSSRVTKQKTVSSSGSSHRNSSPRGLGGAGYDNYRSGSRTSNYPADMAAIQLPEQHGIATYDTYYDDHAGYSNGYGNDMQSFTTEGSVGTGRGHGYAGNPIYGGYDDHRTGSSYNANPGYGYDDHDRHLGTGASLRPVSEVSRGSEASIGTVDFGLPKGYQHPALRPTGDSFRAEDVPNLADTQLTFNDAEVSKQTVEYIDSLRSQQQYRPSDQASDYVSDFGSTTHTFDFRDSTQSSSDYMASYRSTDHQFTDTNYQRKKRNQSDADSESYEF